MSRDSWAILLVTIALLCVSCAHPTDQILTGDKAEPVRVSVQKPMLDPTSQTTTSVSPAEFLSHADSAIYVQTMRLGEREGAEVPRSYTGVVRATRTSDLGSSGRGVWKNSS